MEPWFLWKERERKKKKISFRDVKEVSDRAVITACQIAPAQEMIWIFLPPFYRAHQNKRPPTPPHPLSNLPWWGPAGWGARMDREGFARGLQDEIVWLWMCLYLCWRCVHLRGMTVGWGGLYLVIGWWWWGVSCNFFQNAAIVSKIEQCRAVILTSQSINYLLCA